MLNARLRYGALILCGVLVAFGAIYLHGTSSCESQNKQFAKEAAEQPNSEQRAANKADNGTTGREQEQADPAYGSDTYVQPQTPWLCDFHLSDIGLVFFTYCLVIVGWEAIARGESNTRQMERAMVGPTIGAAPQVDVGNQVHFTVVIVNSGRTIGIIKKVYFGKRDTVPADSEAPTYPQSQALIHEAMNNFIPVGGGPGFAHDLGMPLNSILFGYIRYQDIFQAEHVNRFCNQVTNTGIRVVGPNAWNDWD